MVGTGLLGVRLVSSSGGSAMADWQWVGEATHAVLGQEHSSDRASRHQYIPQQGTWCSIETDVQFPKWWAEPYEQPHAKACWQRAEPCVGDQWTHSSAAEQRWLGERAGAHQSPGFSACLLLFLATKRSLVFFLPLWVKRKLTPSVSAGVKLSSCLLLGQTLEQKPVLSRNESGFVLIVLTHPSPSSRQPQDQQALKRWAISSSCKNRQQLKLDDKVS